MAPQMVITVGYVRSVPSSCNPDPAKSVPRSSLSNRNSLLYWSAIRHALFRVRRTGMEFQRVRQTAAHGRSASV